MCIRDRTDNSLTDSQETDTPGEAVFTGSTGFAAQAKISREPVSYTHLDVYKRQVLCRDDQGEKEAGACLCETPV